MSVTMNAWGKPITTPLDAIRSGEMSESIQIGIGRIFAEFLLPSVTLRELTRRIWDVSADADMAGFDRRLQNELVGRLDETKIRALLDQRALHVARQIAPHLAGASMLDVGTGDGMVAWNVRSRFDHLQLSDVMDYRDARASL